MSTKKNQELFAGLPPYSNGQVSEKTFNGGYCLCDSRVIENPDDTGAFKNGEKMSGDEFRDRIESGLTFRSFAYSPTGSVRLVYLHNNRMVLADYENGTVSTSFLDMYCPGDAKPELVRVVTGTDREAFLQYIGALEKGGFRQTGRSELENNLFLEYEKDGRLIECEFFGNTKKAVFIDDPCSCPLDRIGYEADPSVCVEWFQYGLNHRRMVSGFTCDCGMCYVLRLSDNSLVVVDGGEVEQITARTAEGLWNLMCRITATPADGKIRIAAWYCTHAHNDHAEMFAFLLKQHHEQLELERVLFNYPDPAETYIVPQLYHVINRIREYYPDVLFRKLHTGDRIRLAGEHLTVLQSHEAGYGAEGSPFTGHMNDTSTVLKVESGPCSLLLLGDIDQAAEKVLLENYTEKALHANVVQAAHHVFNFLISLYDVVHADYCFVPQNPSQRYGGDRFKFAQIAKTVPYHHFLFAGAGTDGLKIENGGLSHYFHQPLIADLYDGSRP